MATPSDTDRDDASDVEDKRRFDNLRRELWDDLTKRVDWWLKAITISLTAIVIVLAVFSIVAAVVGYRGLERFDLGLKRFNEIEVDARRSVDQIEESAEEVRELVAEIEAKRDEAELHTKAIKKLTAKEVQSAPDETDKVVQSIQANPSASPIDRVIAAAVLSQRQGNIEEAIEKWRAIANVADGIDKDLEARAWFSVGYLHSRPQEAIDAYDEAIRLKPDYAEAYNNRGNVKSDLNQHEEAIADHDKAIRLKPDLAEAYNNRGNAKSDLNRHEDAIADYDEAIQLKPDLTEAYYNRGNAKVGLGRYEDAIADYDKVIRLKPDYAAAYNNRAAANLSLGRKGEARRDFETALRLANAAGDETMTIKVRGILKKFFDGGDP